MAGSKSSLLPGLNHIWGRRLVYGNYGHILTSKCGCMLRSSFVLPSLILRSSFLHLPEALFGAIYHPIYAGCCLLFFVPGKCPGKLWLSGNHGDKTGTLCYL